MSLYFMNFIMVMVLTFMLLSLGKLTSYKTTGDREKSSPFECGFDPKNSARTPFSLRFFLLAVIFLVFDIEIALLLPAPFTMLKSFNMYSMIACFLFFLILLLGLIHEWHEGSLDWAI